MNINENIDGYFFIHNIDNRVELITRLKNKDFGEYGIVESGIHTIETQKMFIRKLTKMYEEKMHTITTNEPNY